MEGFVKITKLGPVDGVVDGVYVRLLYRGYYMAAQGYEIFFNTRREILYLQATMQCSIYHVNTNEIPNHFI